VLHLLAQRRAQRAAPDLLREVVAVVAGGRALHRAALPPEWRAIVPDPRAAGVLLLPGLLAAARHLHAVLGVVRAAPPARHVIAHGVVHQVALHGGGEDLVGQGHGPDLLAARVLDVHLGHRSLLAYLPVFAAAACFLGATFVRRIVRYVPAAPGTAPCTAMRLRSASTRTIFRLRTVTRVPP